MDMNRYRFQDAVEDKENIIFRETRQTVRAAKIHPDNHSRQSGGEPPLPFYAAAESFSPPSVHTWTPPPTSASKAKKRKNSNGNSDDKKARESTELKTSGARKSPSPPSSEEDEGCCPQKRPPPRMADEDTVFSCLTCFKRFDNVCDLQLHVKTHKVYPCAFCGAEYRDHRALRMHLFNHPAEHEAEESVSSD